MAQNSLPNLLTPRFALSSHFCLSPGAVGPLPEKARTKFANTTSPNLRTLEVSVQVKTVVPQKSKENLVKTSHPTPARDQSLPITGKLNY